jgi:viroplasmin and RNaseH domain-containing protein
MITVIENKNFVEGIFASWENAEKYLIGHPGKETCLVKDITIKEFPFFIVETNFGEFIYFSTKEEIINYIRKINMEEIKKKKRTIIRIDENNNDEIERIEEESITIYVIKKPYINEVKNEDAMGIFEHYHIDKETLKEIKNGNNNLKI